MNAISTKRTAAVGMMLIGIFMAVWLAGCQTFGQGDMGRVVPEANRVAIPSPGQTSTGTFDTNAMTIDYQCRRVGDQLKIWGTSKIRFDSIDELIFHLYFLDARGEVISIKNFFSFVDFTDFDARNPKVRLFHRDQTIPAGAVALAIGYNGMTGKSPSGTFEIPFMYSPFDK